MTLSHALPVCRDVDGVKVCFSDTKALHTDLNSRTSHTARTSEFQRLGHPANTRPQPSGYVPSRVCCTNDPNIFVDFQKNFLPSFIYQGSHKVNVLIAHTITLNSRSGKVIYIQINLLRTIIFIVSSNIMHMCSIE